MPEEGREWEGNPGEGMRFCEENDIRHEREREIERITDEAWGKENEGGDNGRSGGKERRGIEQRLEPRLALPRRVLGVERDAVGVR